MARVVNPRGCFRAGNCVPSECILRVNEKWFESFVDQTNENIPRILNTSLEIDNVAIFLGLT